MLSSPGFNNRLMPLIILPLLQPRKSQYWQISLRVPCEQKILAFTYLLLPQSMQEVCCLPCAFSQELHRIYDTCFFVSCDSTCMTCDTECTSASVCYGDIRTRIWHFHIHGSNFPVCHACRPSWSVPCHHNWHTDFSECRVGIWLIPPSFLHIHSCAVCHVHTGTTFESAGQYQLQVGEIQWWTGDSTWYICMFHSNSKEPVCVWER